MEAGTAFPANACRRRPVLKDTPETPLLLAVLPDLVPLLPAPPAVGPGAPDRPGELRDADCTQTRYRSGPSHKKQHQDAQ